MSKQSTTSYAITVNGDGLTGTYTPKTSPIVNPVAPEGVPREVLLTTGDNTINFPAGTKVVMITPPSVPPSTIAKTIRTVNGDSGLPLDPASTFMWVPAAGTTSCILHVAAGETVEIAFA